MTPPRNALIIGGGVAGAATAMALHKAGIEPVVFEARASATGQGAFLTLGSNGIEALDLLEAGDLVLVVGFPTPAMTLRSGTGKRLGEVRASTARPDGPTSRTLKRSDFAGALLDEVERRGIRVERGRRFAGAEERADGVHARFTDGVDAAGDVLIGADGVHPAVRRVDRSGGPGAELRRSAQHGRLRARACDPAASRATTS